MLILHLPDDKKGSRDISREPPVATAQAATIPHIRTEACIADDHAPGPSTPEKAHSDPCLSGLDSGHTAAVIDLSGSSDAESGDVILVSSSADDQGSLGAEGQDLGNAPSRTSLISRAFGSDARDAGGKQAAAVAALQDSGWQGVQRQALQDRPHKLQAWFGVDAFLTLIPSSYSRRILNEQASPTHCLTSYHH